jgi:hypothetical protein
MKTGRRKGFESIGSAAARLLAELEQRANRASGGLKRPEQIQDSGTGPSSTGENAGSRSAMGEETLQGSPQHTVAGRSRDGLVLKAAANDNVMLHCRAPSFGGRDG